MNALFRCCVVLLCCVAPMWAYDCCVCEGQQGAFQCIKMDPKSPGSSPCPCTTIKDCDGEQAALWDDCEDGDMRCPLDEFRPPYVAMRNFFRGQSMLINRGFARHLRKIFVHGRLTNVRLHVVGSHWLDERMSEAHHAVGHAIDVCILYGKKFEKVCGLDCILDTPGNRPAEVENFLTRIMLHAPDLNVTFPLESGPFGLSGDTFCSKPIYLHSTIYAHQPMEWLHQLMLMKYSCGEDAVTDEEIFN